MLKKLLFLASLMMAQSAMAQTTVIGSIKDAAGNPIASGTIIFELSQEGIVSDPALLLQFPRVLCSINNGQVAAGCIVRGNDTISPAGTFYRVRIVDAAGRELLPQRRYIISGTTWNIGTAAPLAADLLAAQAYQTIQDEGIPLLRRTVLNLVGDGVVCADDSAGGRTTCTITGGGAGSTHQIDGVNLAVQTPVNFQDSTHLDFSNPSAGNITAAIKPGSITTTELAAGAVTNAKVSSTAAIAESKLALNFPTHSNANDPTSGEKAALAGTAGTPSATNRYVTDADPRNSNSRTPTAHAATHQHGGTDEVAVTVPAANAIPKADAVGKLADGWLSANVSLLGQTIGTTEIENSAVTFAKFQSIATDRLLGRDTAGTGAIEELTVTGGIEFTGTGGIRTSAFTGDVNKTAGGTVLTIAPQTSSFWAGKITDETGTGLIVFQNTPALITPDIADFTVAGLPAAGTRGRVALVTDGQAKDDCTTGGGTVFVWCMDTGTAWVSASAAASGGTNHNLLSTTHPDTVAAAVARGDLITGQGATPAWQRLPLGAAGTLLRSNGTDVLWSLPNIVVNSQVGTTYTFTSSDRGKLVTFNNASPVAVSLPQAGSAGFDNEWFTEVENLGAGTVTITPTISTVDGASSITLEQGEGILIRSDNTNYFTVRGRLRQHTHQSAAQGGLLDAAAIATGTLADARLSANVSLLGQTIQLSELDSTQCVDGEIIKKSAGNWSCGVDSGGAGSGDNISVNGTAATDANFVDQVATATAPAVSWTLNSVPTPNQISLTVGAASGTQAGIVTAQAQTFGGDKTFGRIFLPDTSATAPGLARSGDPDTGMFFTTGTYRTQFTIDGVDYLRIGPNDIRWRGGLQPSANNSFISSLATATLIDEFIRLDVAQPTTAGQKDSFQILWRGTAFDTVGHNADWRCWVDVTSNSGASRFVCDNRIDAAAYQVRWSVTDDGLVSADRFDAATGFQVAGAALNFSHLAGTVATAQIADAAVTNTKLRNSAATSVIGRATATSGSPADIIATADDQVLRRSGGTLAFGSINGAVFGSQAANTFLAAPDGAAGTPSFRALADADIPAAITRDTEWPSATATLTNKVLNVEATGNTLTTVSRIWIPAASCIGNQAALNWDDDPAQNEPAAACVAGTNVTKAVADFVDTAINAMQTTLLLPSDWTATGGVDVRVMWFSPATTGSVVWQIATSCVADGETDDPTFNTASTVTDAAKTTANLMNEAVLTSITVTGCAAGELLHLRLLRDPNHASDNLNNTARLYGIELTLRRAQ
jgi:hypothetical protein